MTYVIYIGFLQVNKKYSGIYNAGFENKSILEIAKFIKNIIPSKINIFKDLMTQEVIDDSTKIIKIGFKPKKTIRNAIDEIRKNTQIVF